jgi:tetratricopeptide (TPR) repeat protein
VKLFAKFFSKSPDDLLVKGDRFLESERFFDARTCFEDGLQLCVGEDSLAQKEVFKERIITANFKLAELNMAEAEFALSRGDSDKAIDHLELVKTLTYDTLIREKADKLLVGLSHVESAPAVVASPSSCNSCSHTQDTDDAGSQYVDDSLHPLEYFDLLIRQLPEEQYQRYSGLGEDFAYAYVAACQDKHLEALSLFDKWSSEADRDIYFCERGKVLHRLGSDTEAEQYLRKAVQINEQNNLAWLNLALLLIDSDRLDEAMLVLEKMISFGMLTEQSMFMRGEILEASGKLNEAIDQYSLLLTTHYARTAAEKLHDVLITVGRHSDAALVFKQFLGKCGGH